MQIAPAPKRQLLAGLVLYAALAFGRQAVAQINGFGRCELHDVPMDALAELLPELTQKPVVVSQGVVGSFSYTAKPDTSRKRALQEIRAQLMTQGFVLTNMGDVYFKLVRLTETNTLTDSTRIEVEIRDNAIIVDGQPVPLESLAATITGSVTPDTELWVQDATHHTRERGNERFMSLFLRLQNEVRPKFHWSKIFRAYLPKGGRG
jgi:hypothetical protein